MFAGAVPNFLGPVGIDTGGGGGGFNPIAETTLDITGLTAIDMTGLANYGIINLTSANPAETINKINNLTANQQYVFRPANGLQITWNDKSTLGPGVGNLRLSNGAIIVDGSKEGFMVLQRRTFGVNTYFYSREYLDVYF